MRARPTESDAPHAAGHAIPLSAIHLGNNGSEEVLTDGSVLHRLSLSCSSCSWLSVELTGVRLRRGERLFVHGERGVGAQGAYEREGMAELADGRLSTPPIPGTLLVLEVHTPPEHAREPLAVEVVGAIVGTSVGFGLAALATRDAESLQLAAETAQQGEPMAQTVELPWLQVVLDRAAAGATDEQGRMQNDGSWGRSLTALRGAPLSSAVGTGGECMVDVSCEPIWADVARGVVAVLIQGGLCTGSLINTRGEPMPDESGATGPLLLTGFHCVRDLVEQRIAAGWRDGAAGSFVPATVIYNWRSPGCAHPQAPESWRGSGLQATYGAVLVAYANDSDVALLRLAAPPPAAYRVRLNGWNAGATPPQHCATIHHPGGDLQKLAISFSPPVSSLFCPGCCTPDGQRVVPTQRCWRQPEWLVHRYDIGSSSHGSSGAPLFDDHGLVIGQMHGGFATCAHPRDDFFGQLSRAYNNSLRYEQPMRASMLWPHIDPQPDGSLRMQGADASPESSRHFVSPPALRVWSAAYTAGHTLRLRKGAWFSAPLHLALTQRPYAEVTVTLILREGAEKAIELSQSVLVFTPSEWYVPAVVSLRAHSNATNGAALWIDVSSADDAYNGVTPPPFAIMSVPNEVGSAALCTAGTPEPADSSFVRLGLGEPTVLAVGAGAQLYRELSSPNGCPSAEEATLVPTAQRAALASTGPTAVLLPAGRYALSGGGWRAQIAPNRVCSALWSAASAHTLTCGATLSGAGEGASTQLSVAPPQWIAEAVGAHMVGEESATPPLVDIDGDGRMERIFRFRLPAHVSALSIDSCGSVTDARLRVFRGCPWQMRANSTTSGAKPLLAQPVAADGDSGTLATCRSPLRSRRLARGNDAVISRRQPLPPGDYWLVLDSDAEENDIRMEWTLRATCEHNVGNATGLNASAFGHHDDTRPQRLDGCVATTVDGCASCTGLPQCGWCATRPNEGACLTGREEGPLLHGCDGRWMPFVEMCGVSRALPSQELALAATHVASDGNGSGRARAEQLALTGALLVSPLALLVAVWARSKSGAAHGGSVARTTPMV